MTDEEALQVLREAFGKIDLQKVRQALAVLQSDRAFITHADLGSLMAAAAAIQKFQSSLRRAG